MGFTSCVGVPLPKLWSYCDIRELKFLSIPGLIQVSMRGGFNFRSCDVSPLLKWSWREACLSQGGCHMLHSLHVEPHRWIPTQLTSHTLPGLVLRAITGDSGDWIRALLHEKYVLYHCAWESKPIDSRGLISYETSCVVFQWKWT